LNDPNPSGLIDARIKELGDWRGTMLEGLIHEADPDVVEDGSGAVCRPGTTTG
jgi:hypothetical protein